MSEAALGTLTFKEGHPVYHYGEAEEKHVIPSFFKKQVLHVLKSKGAGKEVFIERDYIRIEIIGARDVFIGPVNESHMKRFPQTWALYVEGLNPQEGTPLEQLPGMSADTIAEYRGMYHCGTIEALSEVTDAGLIKLGPGARDWQKIAKLWLKDRDTPSQNNRLVALEAEIAKLRADKKGGKRSK
jgi:hypothetical protein